MEAEEPERQLKCVEVEVKCKLSGSDSPPSIYKVRVRPSDNLRKIKRHIIESLDIQGKLMYGDHNVDDHPYRRLEDGVLRGNKFYLTIDRKHRDLKQHSVKLHLHEVSGENVRPVEVKIARTTTIVNLKRKIQNEFGIPVEEQSIHVQYQQKGCQLETNVMQLPQPLEVKWQKKECGSPVKSTRKVQQQKISHGTPYDVKLSSKRKGYECSSIHPKKLAKSKEAENQEAQGGIRIPLQHVAYETLHQLGKGIEEFKKDKSTCLTIECKHSRDEENKVDIKIDCKRCTEEENTRSKWNTMLCP